MLVPIALAMRVPAAVDRPQLRLLGAATLLETVGFVALTSALDIGPVAVASVVMAQFSTVAVLLAALVLHERLLRHQWIGVAMMIAATTIWPRCSRRSQTGHQTSMGPVIDTGPLGAEDDRHAARRSPSLWIRRVRIIPLYQQVQRSIAEHIAAGRLAPGEQLPSERGSAPGSASAASRPGVPLASLVEKGLIEASPGKGWFVSDGPLSEPPNALLSFTALAHERGLKPSATVLLQEIRDASMDEAESLQMAPGAEVLELERVGSWTGSRWP